MKLWLSCHENLTSMNSRPKRRLAREPECGFVRGPERGPDHEPVHEPE